MSHPYPHLQRHELALIALRPLQNVPESACPIDSNARNVAEYSGPTQVRATSSQDVAYAPDHPIGLYQVCCMQETLCIPYLSDPTKPGNTFVAPTNMQAVCCKTSSLDASC